MKGKEARFAEFKRVTNERLFGIQQQARVYQDQIASLEKVRRAFQAPAELALPKDDPITRIPRAGRAGPAGRRPPALRLTFAAKNLEVIVLNKVDDICYDNVALRGG